MNRKQAHGALADGTSACSRCHVRPRLGALSRCGECVRAEAEVDRQSRQAAESCVATRKGTKEAEARATAERHAALEKLGELYLQFAAEGHEKDCTLCKLIDLLPSELLRTKGVLPCGQQDLANVINDCLKTKKTKEPHAGGAP